MTERTLSRRSLLGGVAAGGLSALAGCSFGQDKPGDSTPTATSTATSTPTSETNKTRQTIDAGRTALVAAWSELRAHRPIAGGQLALVTVAVEEFDKSEINSSLTLARNKLEIAREGVNSETRSWVNALLVFGDYIEHKATVYQDLFTAHSKFSAAVIAYGHNLLREAIADAHNAETSIAEASIATNSTQTSLRTLMELDQQSAVRLMEVFETFDLEAEDTELSLLTDFFVEYSPAISSSQRYFQGMQYLHTGADAYDAEKYQTTIEVLEDAHNQFVSAKDYAATALNRDVRYHTEIIKLIDCLTPPLQETATLYEQAANAAQQGRMSRAESLWTQGSENYRTALQECRATVQ